MNVHLGHSLAWRMILPIPLTVIAAIAVIWLLVPRMIAANAIDEAILASRNVALQFKTIRDYYTENVVDKIALEGTFKASSDHKGDARAIPLPVTMVHDLSALLTKQDTTIRLYSKFPFPHRSGRPLDAFQQEAWDFLSKRPAGVVLPQRGARWKARCTRGGGGHHVGAGLRQLPQHDGSVAKEGLEARRLARRSGNCLGNRYSTCARRGAEPIHHHRCDPDRARADWHYTRRRGQRDEANREPDRRNAGGRGRQLQSRCARPRPPGRDWATRSRLQQHGVGTCSRARARSRRSSPYRGDAAGTRPRLAAGDDGADDSLICSRGQTTLGSDCGKWQCGLALARQCDAKSRRSAGCFDIDW